MMTLKWKWIQRSWRSIYDEEEVVPKVDHVSLVDGVFDGAFGGDGDKDFIIGEGVVVSSSLLVKSIKSCLGEMMVSLIFLEVRGGSLSRRHRSRRTRKKMMVMMMNRVMKMGESSYWQYKFPLPVKVVPTARRLEMPLPKVYTAIEEMMKKLPVKDRWELH
nr:hypothetical protein [Tanacetum cinerariifolium]